jgi:hypothetical protein
MKQEILKRAMFAKPLSKAAKNSGIMAGFEDEMEMEGEEDEMLPMARTPQNPEILMNNLRGDMRSVDARYQELADMVGEQAAQETPPQVLALLQEHMAMMQQPQGGIGGLPQGQEMAPPGMPPPGGPEGMPPGMPPQGMPPAMPPGMEGAPPFPQGGAEQAPPTPDGLPPVRAAAGKFITKAAQYANEGADAFRAGLNRVDEYLGNIVARPQFETTLMSGQPSPNFPGGKPIFTPASENIRMDSAGRPIQGDGKSSPYVELANTLNLRQPTLTEAIGQTARRAEADYPRSAELLRQMKNAPPSVKGISFGAGAGAAMMSRPGEVTPDQESAIDRVNQIPGQGPVTRDAKGNLLYQNFLPFESGFVGTGEPPVATPAAKAPEADVIETPAEDKAAGSETNEFIKRATEVPTKTRAQRIKAEYEDIAPTFRELLGDNKDDIRTNALLLLADAGFKFASEYKPTMAMALGSALSGLPRGMAMLIAQAKERGIKVNTAALQQAVDNVTLQDKFSQEQRLTTLKGDYKLMEKQYDNAGYIFKDGGAGLIKVETRKGSYVESRLNSNDPAVKAAITSRYNLTDSNPYVTLIGRSPSVQETNEGERIKLLGSMRDTEGALRQIERAKNIVQNAYSPGTFFTSVYNQFVPIIPGAQPRVNAADVAIQLKSVFNNVSKNAAAINNSGRVAVQQQEWERDNLSLLDNPEGFFKDPELAAKTLNSLESMYRNARQQTMEQLGWEDREFTMRTPETGTQNDPFVIPADPDMKKRMYSFLGSTIGTVQNPNAVVYLKGPDGVVKRVNPSTFKNYPLQ